MSTQIRENQVKESRVASPLYELQHHDHHELVSSSSRTLSCVQAPAKGKYSQAHNSRVNLQYRSPFQTIGTENLCTELQKF